MSACGGPWACCHARLLVSGRPRTACAQHRRGIPAPRADAGTGQDAEDGSGDDDDAEEEPEQPRLVLPKPGQAAAKRAKIEAVWQALNSRDMGGSNACKPPSSSISLAALCGRSKEQNVPTPELVRWAVCVTQPCILMSDSSRVAGGYDTCNLYLHEAVLMFRLPADMAETVGPDGPSAAAQHLSKAIRNGEPRRRCRRLSFCT